jgi:hypothetical protein
MLSRFGRRQRAFMFLVALTTVMLIASCATQPYASAYDPPGFFSGILHGFLILFSFVGGLFTDYRIYAFPNSGGWYDFGFLVGAAMFLGGSARAG